MQICNRVAHHFLDFLTHDVLSNHRDTMPTHVSREENLSYKTELDKIPAYCD